jgi:hypothetical protein
MEIVLVPILVLMVLVFIADVFLVVHALVSLIGGALRPGNKPRASRHRSRPHHTTSLKCI